MLIPSIDLQGGRIVQLVQGEHPAVETTDFEGWIRRFASFPKIQLIDLDAAKSVGDNDGLVRALCAQLPCRVGGGVRDVDRALRLLDAGARKVILGSALFTNGAVDVRFASQAARAAGRQSLIAAVDARGGKVAIHGWRTTIDLTPVAAIAELEPYVSEFLFTNVDVEGLMQGIDKAAVQAVRNATTRQVTAAGGVTTHDDVAWLESIGVDAVAGMAIYTGRLKI